MMNIEAFEVSQVCLDKSKAAGFLLVEKVLVD